MTTNVPEPVAFTQKSVLDRHDKRFLDLHSKYAANENGTISWSLNLYKNNNSDGTEAYELGCDLQVRDCHRTTNFSFYVGPDDPFQERINKVDSFIDSLTKLREALVAADNYKRNGPRPETAL